MSMRATARLTVVLAAALVLLPARAGAGDRQLRPFMGATFGGGTTFVDPEDVAGQPNLAIGVDAVFLGEIFGVEIDVADAPGYFESGDNILVRRSRVMTVSGNVVVAAPHRLTEYSLRPYLVGGAGLMRVSTTTTFGVFDVSSVIPAVDVGVGVVGFITNRFGVSWDVRRFQSVGSHRTNRGVSFGDQRLSFWRANMAVAIRY
jgi:hypothetical protein